MKFLKGLLIFVVILVLILVVITFILPSEVNMERSRVIEAPKEVVFAQVNDLRKWEQWSPWAEKDTAMTDSYSNNPVGEGATYTWQGNEDVGEGKMTITESQPHERIEMKMHFGEAGTADANWVFEEVPEGTKATWTFHTDASQNDSWLKRTGGKWSGLMMDSFLGPDYEKGLTKLDSVARNAPAFPKIEVERINIPKTWYIGKKVMTDMAGVQNSELYAQGFGAVQGFLQSNEAQMTGAPMSIVHKYDEEGVEMELAIPVADSLSVPDSLVLGCIPEGPGIKTTHTGTYETLGDTWGAFEHHIENNQVQVRWSPYEVYLTDPSTVADPSEIKTDIVFPVSEEIQ